MNEREKEGMSEGVKGERRRGKRVVSDQMEEQFHPFSLLTLNHRDNIVVDEELWKKGNRSCDQTRHFTLAITHIFVG